MKKRKKFYAVWGTNGVGVYNDWNEVLCARPYLKNFHSEKYDNFKDAERKALWEYNLLQEESCIEYFNGPLSLNYIMYKKQIKQKMGW